MSRKLKVVIAGMTMCVGGVLLAGSLTPPVGPVAPTFKTLNDIEPRTLINAANTPGDAGAVYVISQPGSYYLGANFTAPAGKDGIKIAANDVTIDLNGFTVGAVASGSKQGITTDFVGYTDITVRNGTVRGFAQGGVDLYACNGGTIENVRVLYNSMFGIRSQASGVLRGCTADHNAADGIQVYTNAIAEDCTATDSGQAGFASMYGDATLSRCRSTRNGTHGFNFTGTTMLDHCVAYFNDIDGFSVGDDSVLDGCQAMYNSAIGIYGSNRCTVRDCQANNNDAQGIYVNDYCQVVGNQCSKNGAFCCTGIFLQGIGNRCEDNTSTLNDYGVWAGGTDNVIVKNICRGNSGGNFVISNGNEMAPIVTNPGSTSPAFGTATPWSNFAY